MLLAAEEVAQVLTTALGTVVDLRLSYKAGPVVQLVGACTPNVRMLVAARGQNRQVRPASPSSFQSLRSVHLSLPQLVGCS